ncbi:MAG: sensor histidine kinase [Bdellovibrionales bacterium]
MTKLENLKPSSVDAIVLLKVSVVALFSLYFLAEIGMWQIILAKQIFYKKAGVLLSFCALYFAVYNLKDKVKFENLVTVLCFFDVFFIGVYSFYSPIPLNLFVGVLSLNVLVAGFNLSFVKLLAVTSLSIFTFTLFLNFKGLLGADYSFIYFFLNALSFVIYGGASHFLQRFFTENKGEVKTLTKHLFKQRELNKAVLSSMESSVFITGHEGMPIPLNNAARDLLSDELVEVLKPLSAKLERGESFVKELVSGGRFYKVYGSGLKSDLSSDQTKQNVLLVNDETEAKRSQGELEEARKLSAIGTLSAGLAHEIRNPLAGISGSIELIKEGAVDPEDSKKLFNTVLKEIDRLNLLITDFLSFARPEVCLVDQIEMASFMEEIALLLRQDPRSEGITLEVKCAQAELMVDQHKLRQVLINLIVNSFQAFTSEQKALLKTSGEVCKVSIIGEKLDSGYSLKVGDNGKGIKKSELNVIFEPFHTTKDKGTGLGLALTHRILDGHGAGISVESQLEKGTVFTILFK